MFRKVLDSFTATHFTVLACTAIAAPTALWGASTASQVIISDSEQHLAKVTGGRLQVYNPTSDTRQAYTTDPANFVDITDDVTDAQVDHCSVLYTIPSGKALVITSTTGHLNQHDGSSNGIHSFFAFSNTACSGKIYFGTTTNVAYAPYDNQFPVGIIIPPGSVLSAYHNNEYGTIFLQGYLVPAAAVPPSATVPSSASLQMSKLHRSH